MTLIVAVAFLLVPLVALAGLIWWHAMFRRVHRSTPNDNKSIAGVIPNNIRWTPVSLAQTRSFETEMAMTTMTLFPEEHGINDM